MVDWPADRVERRTVASLVAYARNARTHSAEQVAQIAASIQEFGWTIPVLVDESGGIIAGHGRVLAASELGLPEVPVMTARGWSEAQRRAYVILDNQLPLNAGWDHGLLRDEIEALDGLGFNLDLLGFDAKGLGELLADPEPPGDFPGFGDDIPTEHQCPRCRYRWSGSSAPTDAAA
jgi:ParB-like chromosome segregation protein Spo0J